MSNLAEHLAEQDAITATSEADAANQLDDMACPQCGQREAFHIAATVWGAFTAEGFDSDADGLPSYDNDWAQYNPCLCPKCGKAGIVEDFLS